MLDRPGVAAAIVGATSTAHLEAHRRIGELVLDDADRAPWLDAIATEIERQARTGRSAIFTCSALRRIYRDRLRRGSGYLRFVFLDGERELIAGRMAARRDHFMPPTLLPSQLATLERPDGEADVLQVDNSAGIGEIVEQIAAILAAG